jgi:uncharacterized RDD family membrane protein YckC
VNDGTDIVGRRIGAALLDLAILVALLVVVGVIFGKAHTSSSGAGVNLTGASAIVYVALVLAYYVLSEASAGQTLGKRALGIRVRRLDGEPLGVGAVTIRTVLRAIDVLPLFYLLGFIVILVTGVNRRQRIGDLAAGTTVGLA